MQGGLEGELERGAGRAEGTGGEAGGGLDGVPVNWKRGSCWSGSWKGERKISGRELEGEERSEKSWKGGDILLDGDRNLEWVLEGGEEFSTT